MGIQSWQFVLSDTKTPGADHQRNWYPGSQLPLCLLLTVLLKPMPLGYENLYGQIRHLSLHCTGHSRGILPSEGQEKIA